ncbi:Nrap protein [Jimgerdemannia flammicorona]|uniref:U3 small nucleolar RNA-associated protein 22 n=1 Tax=Jimgerdemannia flammicorona TaxID=994334 RepID=A0A433QNB0_9FUNG|nr:Nrap protein [Jimgerdemannia flammicorona]
MAPSKRKSTAKADRIAVAKVAKVVLNSRRTTRTEEIGNDSDPHQAISDDDEDLLMAATTGKYDSHEDDGDSDENDDKKYEYAQPGHKSEGSHYYQAPTSEEIQGLKEASDLFKSNIFKLEIEELLAEVRIDYSKLKPLEAALHQLKALFDGLPDEPDASLAHIKSQMSKKYKISIPFPDPQPSSDIQYTFGFKKPTAIHLVGSFPLKTLTRSRDRFNVDVAVEMPTRAYYLAVLAKGIQSKHDLNVNLEFSTFNGDCRRPILILNPSGDKSDTDFTKSKCIIRILPSIPTTLFPASRLSPSRNNVRQKDHNTHTDINMLPATPLYNASILQDSTFTSNLVYLYKHVKACPAFVDACLLGKVWLRQRGMASYEQNGSTMNGFVWSMIMAYLLDGGGTNGGKKLSSGYSCYQLMKGTIDYIAQHDFDQSPIVMGNAISDEKFRENFEVVIVDPSGKVNLAAGMPRAAVAQLKYEARLAQKYFDEYGEDRFDTLFLTTVNELPLYYDNIARLPAPSKTYPRYTAASKLGHIDFFEHFARDVSSLLAMGLTNRVHLIGVHHEPLQNWAIYNSPTPNDSKNPILIIGIILNPEHATRLVDQGPPAEDATASAAFRQLWGDKAELRRFKDGSILESVVWDAKDTEERGLIVGRAVQHLLQLHYGIKPIDGVTYWAGQLNPFINLSQPLSAPTKHSNDGTRNLGFGRIMSAFDQFSKQLRTLDDLPIPVANISPASPALRYSSVFLPEPFNLSGSSLFSNAARYIEPIDVVITLEGSTKWPEDVAAVQQIKTAFLLRIAEQLRMLGGTKVIVVDEADAASDVLLRGYMDVFYSPGFVFRCRIQQDRELILLHRIIDDKNEKPWRKDMADYALRQYNLHFANGPMHTFHLQNVCNRFPSLSSTIRLMKRWFGAHLLSSHICDELVELLCAHVFLDPQPWREPASSLAGFARVLHLLSNWNWKNEALIVDLEDSMSLATKDRIRDNLKNSRARDQSMRHAAMFVATARDLESKHWSWLAPSKVIVARIQILSRAALPLLTNMIAEGNESDIKRLYVTPLQDYDFIIHLDPSKCTRYSENIAPETQHTRKVQKYKNLVVGSSELSEQPLVGFDPVERYLGELKATFSDTALFFHNRYGGNFIAVAWNPATLTARQWKVDTGFSSVPVDVDDSGFMVSHIVEPSLRVS